MPDGAAADDLPIHVLFVDDDRTQVDGFRDYVRVAQPSWRAACFADPARAVDYLLGYGRSLQVFVCDVHMPRISGLHLLGLVMSRHPQVTRLALSGMLDRGTLLGCDRLAHRCLCKPVGGAKLCAVIRELVGPASATRLAAPAVAP